MAKIKYHTGNTFGGNKNQISILSDGRNLRAGQFLLYCCIIKTTFTSCYFQSILIWSTFLWFERQAMQKCLWWYGVLRIIFINVKMKDESFNDTWNSQVSNTEMSAVSHRHKSLKLRESESTVSFAINLTKSAHGGLLLGPGVQCLCNVFI